MRLDPKLFLNALWISAASLSLTACGSHMSHSVACGGAYMQPCTYMDQVPEASRYGGEQGQYYQQSYIQTAYVPIYPALRPHTPIAQTVVNHVPAPAPVQISEPAPIIESLPVYDVTPMNEPTPALSSWTPEPWTDDPICPEGTIQGYGGEDCVQVAIPRK